MTTAKPKFQRRHYEVIADHMAALKPAQSGANPGWETAAMLYWQELVTAFADRLAEDNPSFIRDRFLKRAHCSDRN